MSETIQELNLYHMMPTREERARVYMGDYLSQAEREDAQQTAIEFSESSRPMQRTAVMIPVAAHQDASHVRHTLGQYAGQRGADPFTVFLYANAPDNQEVMLAAQETMTGIEIAKRTYPNLDIRACASTYEQSTIGRIRADLWRGVGLLALHEGMFVPGSDDVVGINNDIDTMFISPHYIARIQEHYKRRQKIANRLGIPETIMSAVGTRVSHGRLSSHPNVAKVTSWIYNSYFQSPQHGSYE
ncbi:MAG: hypothetical protein ABIV43_00480, partial [Candidatus Saccharimonadales bacterium]